VTMSQEGDHAQLVVALAGHQPPLLVNREGHAMQIGQPGTLLGMVDPLDITESAARLSAGETLLLYTDGVPEAGRSGEQLGERGLRKLCREARILSLASLLRRIESAALDQAGGRLRDDIALLAVRLLGSGPEQIASER